MELDMSECGKTINKKVMAVKPGKTVQNLRAIFFKGKSMEKVHIFIINNFKANIIGVMDQFIPENGLKIRFQDSEYTNG
jgi:hypothetical protein